jgi:small subunit ribosomal protein S1
MAEEKTTPKVLEEQVDTQATATAEETTKKANYISPAQENPEKFLEEFNWENYKEGIEPIDEGKLDEFERQLC